MRILRDIKIYSSIKLRRTRISYKPNIYNVETTNACGLDCPGCTRHQMKRKVGSMPREVFMEVVRQTLEQTSTKFLWLHHFGDPLLYPEALEEFSNYAYEQGISTGISTKGHLLDAKRINSLKNSRVSKVLFSWVGATKDEFETLQPPARYDETMARVRQYLKVRPDYQQAEVELLSYSWEVNKDVLEAFKREWYSNGADLVSLKICDSMTGDSERVNKAVEVRKGQHMCPCLSPWAHLSVLYNGDIVPCCRDYDGKYVLGNIMETPIKHLWNAPKMVTLREAQLKGERHKIELCKFCEVGCLPSFWDYFNMFRRNQQGRAN